MKRTKFWIFAPLLGLCAMVCRWLFYSLYTDDRGLLAAGSFPEVLLLVLSVAAVFLAFLAQPPESRENKLLSGLAPLLLALGLLLPQERASSVSAILWLLFQMGRYLSAAAAAALGILRIQGKKPPFGLNATVCIGFLLRLVASYQVWSRIPQMQNYVFALASTLCLAGFAYQQAAREVSLGSPLWRLRLAFVGTFASMAASVGTSGQPLYLLCALWLTGSILFDSQGGTV